MEGGPVGTLVSVADKRAKIVLGVLLALVWLIGIGWWVLYPWFRDSGEADALESGQSGPAPTVPSPAVRPIDAATEVSAPASSAVQDGSALPLAAVQMLPELPDRPVIETTHGPDWVVASWSANGEVDRWEVDGPDGLQPLAARGPPEHRMGWEALQPGALVEVRVRAGNASGWSQWASAEVLLPRAPAVPEEAAPTTLSDDGDNGQSAPPPYAAALDGTYVSVLVSAESEEAAERSRTSLAHEHGRPFGVLLSDDFASLNPGYWVVYAGPYLTAKETQAACWWELERRSGAACYGRRLSQDPADRIEVYGPSPD